MNLFLYSVDSGGLLSTYSKISKHIQFCRYHGLFWDVSHQVEKRRNGVTGESWNCETNSVVDLNSFIVK